MVVGGFVWVRLFELVRTCFGSFRFVLIALGCVGLCWAVVVVTSCSRCLRMYRVASIFQSIFLYQFLSVRVRVFLVVFDDVNVSFLSFDFLCMFWVG